MKSIKNINILKIGIIDADLIGRKNHRFPNLACEKISGYYKREKKIKVDLLLDYNKCEKYDIVYVSKVFTDTPVPSWLVSYVKKRKYFGEQYEVSTPAWLNRKNAPKIIVGGTGFYFDKAPSLANYIEHHMPDYHLYDKWIKIKQKQEKKIKGKKFSIKKFNLFYKDYLDSSIGFLTRGCFRKCKFCVNQKYNKVLPHSPLKEFLDPKRKRICFLDDNFLGFSNWEILLNDVVKLKKAYKFKQGLDVRLLTEDKCEILFNSNYDGDFIFAFDSIKDYKLIETKLKIIKKYSNCRNIKFYVLVGFESTNSDDIKNIFKRVSLLRRYGCMAYIMRYMNKDNKPWEKSQYRALYIAIARWCNQPAIYKKMTFTQFCEANQKLVKTKEYICSTMKAYIDFKNKFPEFADKYFNCQFNK